MSAPLRRVAALSVRAALRPTASTAWTPASAIAPLAAHRVPSSAGAPLDPPRSFPVPSVTSTRSDPNRSKRAPSSGFARGFAGDSDDDFKPQVHASGDAEVQAVIAKDVAENRVLLYMKGTPGAPQCGFSNMAVQILNFHGVGIRRGCARLRGSPDGIKAFSSWPTIPQVFIDGEFVGGCDILRQMHSDGELEKALKPDAQGQWMGVTISIKIKYTPRSSRASSTLASSQFLRERVFDVTRDATSQFQSLTICWSFFD